MAIVTKPNTFSAGATIVAAEHNSNFDTIYNDYNGNITNANIAANAAIALSKLDLSSDITFTGDTAISSSATTDSPLTITANSLTTGDALSISSTSTSTAARALIKVSGTSTAATGVIGVEIVNPAGPAFLLPTSTYTTTAAGYIWWDGTNYKAGNGSAIVTLDSTVDHSTQNYVAKAWASVTYSTGTPTLNASYNVSGIVDTAEGQLTVTWDTDFADTNYAVVATAVGTQSVFTTIRSKATGSCVVEVRTDAGSDADPSGIDIIAFGVQ